MTWFGDGPVFQLFMGNPQVFFWCFLDSEQVHVWGCRCSNIFLSRAFPCTCHVCSGVDGIVVSFLSLLAGQGHGRVDGTPAITQQHNTQLPYAPRDSMEMESPASRK